MIVKGIECLKCGDKIVSRHRRDCVYCKCKSVFVDGGRDYLQYGAEEANVCRVVDIEVVQK